MADYTSESGIVEGDVRNFVTPVIDYDIVSKAELLGKIEVVEDFVKYTYFDGGTVPSKAKTPILLLIISNLVSTGAIAKDYYTLSSEKLGSYAYTLSEPMATGDGGVQSSPYVISKTWHQMALDMLEKMSTPSDYTVYKVND